MSGKVPPASSSSSCTEPDDDDLLLPFDDLDHLAARLVNGRLTGVPVEQAVDLARIERAVREILFAIGEDPEREGLRRTPARVARAYAELFAGLRVDPASVVSTRVTKSSSWCATSK
jgi:GTP cyclohydrolase IA